MRGGSRIWTPPGLPAAAAILAMAIWAPAAVATDYCVAPDTTCGGTNVATFQGALDLAAAASDPDRIFLGAHTYVAPTAGFQYTAAGSPVDIVGAGQGQTTLTAPTPSAFRVLNVQATTASVISDLTLALPPDAASGAAALQLIGAGRRVSITAAATQSSPVVGGVLLEGGSFEDGTVVFPDPSTLNSIGINVDPAATGARVARSTVTARTGVIGQADSTLERLLITAASTGVDANGASGGVTVALRSSVVRVVGGGAGLSAFGQPGGPVTLNASGVTVVGDGSAGSTGAYATDFNQPFRATLNLTSSVVRGTARTFVRTGENSAGGADITTSFSNFDHTAPVVNLGVGTLTPPAGSLNPGANIAADPRFVNAAAGDFHLLDGSPAVDAGAPATAAGLDFDGSPWVTDGNGDGVARRDMGAFERPGKSKLAPPAGGSKVAKDVRAAVIRRFRADPSRFAAARKVRRGVAVGTRFRYRLDEAAKATITIQRALPGRRVGKRCRKPSRANRGRKRCTRYVTRGKFAAPGKLGANSKRFNGRLKGRALRVGRYRGLIRALDNAKNRSVPRTARFRILRR